ncbi:hypothetical protein CH68_2000 [Francisella tularensis subsp. holarctica]|uniref:Uncharacterized protein n=1 Tax=Francisella tularensis subsp. holarctica (strain LVS) TaxID=376619 RepID=A0AAI8BFW0_FRATH|nr:hypothetical protein DA46_878 [Francisella tularensis subsp. holarctica]AJI58273.1 hypothetical protein AW21_682 [Francisella tularensis subsp. holarctica LVS]AJI65209.1 hypothetical protein CH67_116 [Francisella tularensis subsp. holarctica]AJI66622.1 hypothetical protein CH68_2000 [Francisella tularensis subsp. holarctica]
MLLGLLKFSQYLYDCYGFMVAVRKILDLLEISKKDSPTSEHKNAKLETEVTSLEIALPDYQKARFDYTQNHFNNLCLTRQQAQKLLNAFFDDNSEEIIKINNVCLSNYSKEEICNKIHIASGIEVVAGTVLDNLCENDFSQEKLKYLSELLDAFGVSFLEKYFEKKIDSQTIKYNLEFDTMVVLKMNLIRAILK